MRHTRVQRAVSFFLCPETLTMAAPCSFLAAVFSTPRPTCFDPTLPEPTDLEATLGDGAQQHNPAAAQPSSRAVEQESSPGAEQPRSRAAQGQSSPAAEQPSNRVAHRCVHVPLCCAISGYACIFTSEEVGGLFISFCHVFISCLLGGVGRMFVLFGDDAA